MTDRFLPYGVQEISDGDVQAVAEALRGEYLTTGPRVAAFEAAFAATCGARHAIACANGTAALHLAALALDIQPGDVVLVPTMSFLASVNGFRYAGAAPVFIDCDPATGLVTPTTFAAAIATAPRPPKAAVVVHLNGTSCDMEAIGKLARNANIVLVEDACHAIGGSTVDSAGQRHPVGGCAFSAMAVFSLHPVKTITMGEGGVVTTNDPVLAARLAQFRTHGMNRDAALMQNRDMAFASDGDPNPWYYEMPVLGYNYRATDFQCALGHSQLQRLPAFADRRRAIQALYDQHFASAANALRPVKTPAHADPVLHLYVVRAPFGRQGVPERAEAMKALKARGIGTMVHYIPIHRQPYYAKAFPDVRCPGADAYYEDILSIPLFPAMTDTEAARVARDVIDIVGAATR
ncbi:MAG: UDP-4-amino-4,6-dideoxy-N-acetyl-beta-L-altrosamine transaminase [Beijerinckiaceae bacterium]